MQAFWLFFLLVYCQQVVKIKILIYMYLSTTTVDNRIRFRKLDYSALDAVLPFMRRSRSRTCDYTIAGMLMWADYFGYEYAVIDNTLFVKGVAENDRSIPAFSLPIVTPPCPRSIQQLRTRISLEGVRYVFPRYILPDLIAMQSSPTEKYTPAISTLVQDSGSMPSVL